MVDKKLTDYVNSAIKSGKSAGEIKKILLGQGWAEKDVNEAIGMLQAGGNEPDEKIEKPKTGHMKIYIIGLIVIILILAGTTYIITMWGEGELSGALARCGNNVCDYGEDYSNCPADCQQPTGSQKVSVSPAAKTVGVGETFTVEIVVSNANDLYGFQFDIEYNPDILKYDKIEKGGFLSRNGADTTYSISGVASPGLIDNIADTRMGAVDGINGGGTLETITFTALSKGTSDIKITNIKFLDSKVKQIQTTGENGQVTVS